MSVASGLSSVPLMDHLWSLAALGHTEGVHSKHKLEESWGVE